MPNIFQNTKNVSVNRTKESSSMEDDDLNTHITNQGSTLKPTSNHGSHINKNLNHGVKPNYNPNSNSKLNHTMLQSNHNSIATMVNSNINSNLDTTLISHITVHYSCQLTQDNDKHYS